jgi:putative Holliday junction resolvase
MIVLGVDYGSRRIGLAASDALGIAAHPLPTLESRGAAEDAAAIARIAAERGAGRILIGLPLNMDGSEGPQARRAREFAAHLEAASGLPVEPVDERLSTWEAQETLKEMGIKARDWPRYVDQLAAKTIVTRWLEKHPRAASSEHEP